MYVARASMCLLSLFVVSAALPAQETQGSLAAAQPSPVITAAAAGQKVRFGSPATVCQIRVSILSAAGDTLFDSAWRDGNFLDWPVDSASEPLTSGSYRCVVMVKDLNGQVTERKASLVARGGELSMEQRDAADAVTIVGADASPLKITLLAHDGTSGSVVSTSGDLIFRFGNFLAGKDSERMRLTAEGALGIGTDKPQAPLDVRGLIRTNEGLMFPDGTILTSAAGLPGEKLSGETKRQRPSALVAIVGAGSGVNPSRSIAATGRLTPRPNAADYQFKVDATGVHIGTTSTFGVDVAGDATLSSNLNLPPTASATAGVIMQGGSRFAHSFGSFNTFVGHNAGNFTMTGGTNTAIGESALGNNTIGQSNTATGYYALVSNLGGNDNTADGYSALANNSNGSYNTASGFAALHSNTTGTKNTAIGESALTLSTTASNNTAIGENALWFNTTGFGNIAIGVDAGSNLTTGGNNIDIANAGVAAESSTIRIGTAGTQTRAFIAGIRAVTTVNADATAVMIDSAGQLGTVSSSLRYKFDVADMGNATGDVMRLRPVTFRYLAHGDQAPLQYGLIAEEVAEIYPEMVTRNQNGEPDAVMYQFLAPMLLNQVQKQQKTIEALEHRLEQLEARLAHEK